MDIYQNQSELELIDKIKIFSEQNSRLLNFSNIVAHNLTSHFGNIESLLSFIDFDKNTVENKEALAHLQVVSNDLKFTMRGLKEIVRIQNDLDAITDLIDLNLYLRKAERTVNTYNHDKKIILINNIPSDTFIKFNSAYMESILLNFITNAVKYSHPERFPIIKFNFFIEQGEKILTIEDNGLGIDLERYGHQLFEMYKTFHKNQNAQGIGLYIVKCQIEAMKARISVQSVVNEGTIFRIVFQD
jgi:signal transduction histidine kinase